MIQDYFTLAIRNLKKKKLRSSLTIIGILISIATIFILISLSIGLNNAVNEQFRLLGTDKFFIIAKGQIGAPGSGGAVELTTKDVEIIKKVRGVKEVSYFVAGNAKIEYRDKARYYMAIGAPWDERSTKMMFESMNLKIEEGRFLKDSDKGKILMGYNYKYANLFDKPIGVQDKIKLNEKEFQVVGILTAVGNSGDDQQVYISMEDFKELFNSGDRVDQIVIQIQSGEDIKTVSENVKRKLMSFRNVNEKTRDFEIMTPEELLRSFGTILDIITAFLLGVAGISLLVGAIGIANTMYTSVLERTKEIGVMKAIGAKNSDILNIFVIESGILGLVGGILGIMVGIIVGKIIEYIAVNQLGTNLLRVDFPWYLIVGCLLFAFLIGSLSGLMPAKQASKLRPADTLRYE
ncbi:MAG: ABC transporter permease [Candidatus Nanoarchaeia archaeon]|nr:ABC transporter permease [Candidatus Nanoarchaeia archaeon]